MIEDGTAMTGAGTVERLASRRWSKNVVQVSILAHVYVEQLWEFHLMIFPADEICKQPEEDNAIDFTSSFAVVCVSSVSTFVS